MKIYKKFNIHLVNGKVRRMEEYEPKTLEEFLIANWPQHNTAMITSNGTVIIPWHGVAMIEGVDDESKEK